MLVVGTDSSRKTKTLKAGADVAAEVRAVAGLLAEDHAEATASSTSSQQAAADDGGAAAADGG